ncbi:MAG: response regulator transcription factor [Anaerolineales bacterium]|nr:DNA-binding response regulator [Chloroflexi bacterium CFX1]MCK6539914.1 response regulator transcription factor [Anaerolineales bacterium]MCQ3952154.1 DNA-binding response regulator [Chloroflexota bacterium]MDL1918829.1 response regulator transcription factor [Chloroflexi bacterium CFX5]NUQ57928.1 response regulator transcription factor [Anaerolineales bacterium]
MAPVRVLLVDDAEEARRDLRAALSLFDGIEIVGEAPNGAEALRLTESLQPDILLMDLEMPFMDGYEAAQRIKSKYPARKIVALTVHDYESAREKAKQSGVDAFLVKGAPVKTIVQAILNSTSVA